MHEGDGRRVWSAESGESRTAATDLGRKVPRFLACSAAGRHGHTRRPSQVCFLTQQGEVAFEVDGFAAGVLDRDVQVNAAFAIAIDGAHETLELGTGG